MRGGGDLEHLEAELFEVGAHELREFLRLGHIDLVEDDDARALRNRDGAQRQFQLVGVDGQLVFERLVVGDGVAVGFERGAVDHVRDDLGAFDVAQEFEAEALALGCAGDQAGHVGDRVACVAGHDDAKVRHERRERIVGDLRLGGADGGDEAGFAGRREADERHVGDGLEFEDDVALLAEFAQQREAGGAAGAVRQRRVAQTARATRCGDEAVAFVAQVGELFAGLLGRALRALRLEDDGADRHGQDQVVALGSVLGVAQAHRAVAGGAMRHEAVVEQAVGVAGRLEDDRSAVAAVAAVGAGQRLVFLSFDAGGAVAAVAALDMDGHSIHKITHGSPLYRLGVMVRLPYARGRFGMVRMARMVSGPGYEQGRTG